MRSHSLRHTQRGAVLVVGLIMLLLITLIAVAAIRMSTTHVQVVANERFKAEATTAASYALDLVINDKDFNDRKLSQAPVVVDVAEAASAPSGPTALTVKYSDPECTRARILKTSELSKSKVDPVTGESVDVPKSKIDQACTLTPDQSKQVFGANSSGSNSLCANTLWDV